MKRGTQRAEPLSLLEQALLTHFSETREVRIGLAAILYAAERRDISWRQLDQRKRLQFDSGLEIRRVNGSVTDRTSRGSIMLAGDKAKARNAMYNASLPVPRQREVLSLEQALGAMGDLVTPLVTKPVRGNDGRGVSIGLESPDEVRRGYLKARKYCERVLLEEQIDGSDFRLLVIGGALVAAVRRIPARVQGDGAHTIRELIDLVNADPQRGSGHSNILTTITVDEDMLGLLRRSNYELESVPPQGAYVYLRSIANVSLGGTAVDVTNDVHCDVENMAIASAQTVGLDIAGVDYIAQDISLSCWQTGGKICEINAGPGLRIHLAPSEGMGRDVGKAVVDWLFPYLSMTSCSG